MSSGGRVLSLTASVRTARDEDCRGGERRRQAPRRLGGLRDKQLLERDSDSTLIGVRMRRYPHALHLHGVTGPDFPDVQEKTHCDTFCKGCIELRAKDECPMDRRALCTAGLRHVRGERGEQDAETLSARRWVFRVRLSISAEG